MGDFRVKGTQDKYCRREGRENHPMGRKEEKEQ